MNSFIEEIVTPEQLEQPTCSENSLWIHPTREFEVCDIQTVMSATASELTKLFTRFSTIRPNWITCEFYQRTALPNAICSGHSNLPTYMVKLPCISDASSDTRNVSNYPRSGHIEGRICNDFVNGAANPRAFSSVVTTSSSS